MTSQTPEKQGNLIFHFPTLHHISAHLLMACIQPEPPISSWRKAAAVRALSVAVFNHNIREMHNIMKTNCKVLAVAFPLKKKGSCHGKPCSPQAFLYLIFCLTIYSKYQRLKYLLIIPSGQGISICSLWLWAASLMQSLIETCMSRSEMRLSLYCSPKKTPPSIRKRDNNMPLKWTWVICLLLWVIMM